jgi:hypothetical protein
MPALDQSKIKAKTLTNKKLRKMFKKFRKKVYLPEGEERTFQYCKKCDNIMVHDYIPYGLGRGRLYNICHCYATGSDKSVGYYETLLTVKAGETDEACDSCEPA